MLNTSKLLYILPDLTYIAELLPGKKEHQFHIQSFRQINGEFLDDNLLIPENITKLVDKLDEEEYHLILPDFLFTNAIVEVLETSKAKVEKHLEEVLLPQLDLSKNTHQIEHFILTSYNNKSKVQICALEKSILEPFRSAAKDKKIKISAVSPLSWTVKSIVSLEPSITVIQIGSVLYLGLHYIGLDQTISFNIDKIENIVETIKTLKGGEPSIQTVYLLTNQLVEEKLKELLSGTLPLQQLTSFVDDEKDLPSYVKQIIESGRRTLSIPDFMVPNFKLGKAGDTPMPEVSAKDGDEEVEEVNEIVEDTKETEDINENIVESEKTLEKEEDSFTLPSDNIEDINSEIPVPTLPVIGQETPILEKKTETALAKFETDDLEQTESEDATKTSEVTDEEIQTDVDPIEKESLPEITEKKVEEDKKTDKAPIETLKEIESTDKLDLHQFAASSEPDTIASESSLLNVKREVIKNNNPSSTMLKMIFITLAVLFVTVGVGVGLGLGFLTISNKTNQADTTPIVEVSQAPEDMASPSPTAEPSPTPEPLNVADLKGLVVNATTTAGKAGKIKTSLTSNDFENIDTGNASGDYDKGTYLLMTKENDQLKETIEKALDLTLEFSDKTTVEDADGDYDFIIVLAE